MGAPLRHLIAKIVRELCTHVFSYTKHMQNSCQTADCEISDKLCCVLALSDLYLNLSKIADGVRPAYVILPNDADSILLSGMKLKHKATALAIFLGEAL